MLIRNLIHRFFHHRVLSQSAQLAFYLMLSFFPCLIILTHFAVNDTVRETLLRILNMLLPSAAAELVHNNLPNLGDFSFLPTGIIVLVYAASRGISTLIYASTTAYETAETRSVIFRFLLRFFLLPLILLLGLSAIICIILLNRLFAKSGVPSPVWQAFRFPIAILTGAVLYAVLYRWLPNIRMPFFYHLPGAVFSAIVSIVASVIFSRFAETNGNYSAYYGNMSGVILLLLWLYLCSMIAIIGIELNAALFKKEEFFHESHRPDTND